MGAQAEAWAAQRCTACRPDSPPVDPQELERFLQAYPAWRIATPQAGLPQLERVYPFKNYAQALAFTNQVAALAEAEDHHPRLTLEWGKVTVAWWTHAIGGLHRNDLIMAARTEQAYQQQERRNPTPQEPGQEIKP